MLAWIDIELLMDGLPGSEQAQSLVGIDGWTTRFGAGTKSCWNRFLKTLL
jgi:hypothetical protein